MSEDIKPDKSKLIAGLYETDDGQFWQIVAPDRKGISMYAFPESATREFVKYIAEWVATKSGWEAQEFLNSFYQKG